MKVLGVLTSEDGDHHLAISFEVDTWAQAEEQSTRFNIALQGAQGEETPDDGDGAGNDPSA